MVARNPELSSSPEAVVLDLVHVLIEFELKFNLSTFHQWHAQTGLTD
jgi:hypothetical protein